MHPILKCCSFYCSGLCVVGIFFFVILLIMEVTKSPFLGENQMDGGKTPNYSKRVLSLGVCIGIFAVCFIGCFFGIRSGLKKEAEEKERLEREFEASLA